MTRHNGSLPLTRAAIVVAALLLSSVPAAPAPPAPAGPDAASVVALVQAWLDGTRDLSARFEQTLVSGAFGDGVSESGKLFVSRPGRMRWEYVDPEEKVAIVDGDRTTLFLAEERELMLGRLDDQGGLLPALLAGEGRLADLFAASLASAPGSGGAAYRLELRPRSADEGFERLEILTKAPDYAIDAVEVLDAAGNRVRYVFTRVRRNRGVADRLFRFEPPPGTVVSGRH